MSDGTTRSVEVLESGPTGTFGSMMEGLEANYSQRTVGGNVATTPQRVGDDRPLEELKVPELREEAKALGLEGLSGANKDDLIAAIEAEYDRLEAEGNAESDDGSETASDDDSDETQG